MLFKDFDFNVFDSPSYKEDAVREDIVAPILREIGYKPSGDIRMERSKPLVHPFVKIGSKDHKINIIPDYTLYLEDTPLLILDAKSPSEIIYKSRHVEQAFSYAIHPDVRAPYYGLCNGRELIIYSLREWELQLHISVQEVDSKWNQVYEALHPKFFIQPELKNLMPDYGMTLLKAGYKEDLIVFTYDFYWHDIIRVEDRLYTSSSTCLNGDIDCIVSFDYSDKIYESLLTQLPPDIATAIRDSLQRQPYRIDLGGKLIVSSGGLLGKVTKGQYEQFVPIVLNEILSIHYDPGVVLEKK